MEKGDMETVTTVSPPAYVSQAPPSARKVNKKTCAIVGTLVACTVVIAVTVVLSFHFVRGGEQKDNEQSQPQTFNINVKAGGKVEKDEVTVDPKKKQFTIRYRRTEDGRDVIVLEDLKTGFMAVKENDEGKDICLVTPIANRTDNIDFDEAYDAIKKDAAKGEVTADDNNLDMKVLTNHTIHPLVLKYTTGDAISEFCSDASSYWLVEGKDDEGDRQTRGLRCYYHYRYIIRYYYRRIGRRYYVFRRWVKLRYRYCRVFWG